MSANAPAVMVSSTFYDLRQIRADLAEFIERDLGYRALLSEYPSFPVDPDTDTVENCRRRVERDADILVLIVGGRYGFVDDASKKSITNLEYLAARVKGIPVYAFVEKSVLSVLPIWERNPEADFSGAVTDSRLFEFIQQVRAIDRVWMHEFERAQDITSILRTQFAYLTKEGLQLRSQFRRRALPVFKDLHGLALRIALEKPEAWEYRLFAQALTDAVEDASEIRREHRLGLVFGSGDHVELDQVTFWMQARMEELQRLIAAFNVVMQSNLQEALGPPGVPGDVKAIAFTARKVGSIYRHAIEWSQRVRRAHLPECFRPVAIEMAFFTDDIIEKVEEYGPALLKQIEEALAAPNDGTHRVLESTLTLDFRNLDRFEAALEKAQRDCFGS